MSRLCLLLCFINCFNKHLNDFIVEVVSFIALLTFCTLHIFGNVAQTGLADFNKFRESQTVVVLLLLLLLLK